MNKRLSIVILALLLIGTFCWLLWPSVRTPKVARETLPTASPIPARTPVAASPPSGYVPGAAPDPLSKEERMAQILSLTSMTPIAFYGRVIDQSGAPVSEVKVTATVQAPRYFMEERWKQDVTATDSKGRFQFKGLHGQDLGIYLEKQGYEFKGDLRRYAYSDLTPEKERHQPDSAAPVVFKMWKQQGAEPLISGDKFLGIKSDGTPFTIDLLKGRKSEGKSADGDLIVSIVQPPQITNGQKFDWSFSIEAIGGGLAEVMDTQYLNEAPAEGYEPKILHELKADDREWSEVVRKAFYVKSRNGNQFARVTAEVRANYQGAAVFSIRYLVNPKPGSRNLEYDPTKQASAR